MCAVRKRGAGEGKIINFVNTLSFAKHPLYKFYKFWKFPLDTWCHFNDEKKSQMGDLKKGTQNHTSAKNRHFDIRTCFGND